MIPNQDETRKVVAELYLGKVYHRLSLESKLQVVEYWRKNLTHYLKNGKIHKRDIHGKYSLRLEVLNEEDRNLRELLGQRPRSRSAYKIPRFVPMDSSEPEPNRFTERLR